MPSARLLCLLTAAGLAAVGCVTSGTHDEVVSERDALEAEKQRLEERITQLESSAESLERERVRLLDQLEDATQERNGLATRSKRQERMIDDLESGLDASTAELALRNEEVNRLKGTFESLVAELEAEVATGQIEIEQLREGIRVNVADEILFPSGSAQLNAQGVAVLKRVAGRLKGATYTVEVQGHSDDQAIRGALQERYPTNWELAGARAARVVRLLETEGVEGDRLSAVSLGPNAPIASNATPEGRSTNRRIEIRLHPVEPQSPSQTAAPAGDPAAAAP